jgi:hypothetical protein
MVATSRPEFESSRKKIYGTGLKKIPHQTEDREFSRSGEGSRFLIKTREATLPPPV